MILSMYSLPVSYNGEDVIQMFLKEKNLRAEHISYVGFELTANTLFKLNGEDIRVPSVGNFTTPIINGFKIKKLEFPNVYPSNIYILY